MMRRRKMAALAVSVMVAVSVLAVGPAGGVASADPPVTANVTFAAFPVAGGTWVARAVLWTPPPPPPATGQYTRVIQAKGKTRAAAVSALLAKMTAQFKPAKAVKVLGQAIAEQDRR